MICSICGSPILKTDTIIGTGTGDGQSFSHELCYYRQELEIKNELLNRALKRISVLNRILDDCYQEDFSEFERE